MSVTTLCSLACVHCFRTIHKVLIDFGRFMFLFSRSRAALAAVNLFLLRKQPALFQERKVRPRRADDSTRWMMATLRQIFRWRDALVPAVEVETGWTAPVAQGSPKVDPEDGR